VAMVMRQGDKFGGAAHRVRCADPCNAVLLRTADRPLAHLQLLDVIASVLQLPRVLLVHLHNMGLQPAPRLLQHPPRLQLLVCGIHGLQGRVALCAGDGSLAKRCVELGLRACMGVSFSQAACMLQNYRVGSTLACGRMLVLLLTDTVLS